jgi:hypothetical protein
MKPRSAAAVYELGKGNHSWYNRRLYLVLLENPELRAEVERKMMEVKDD